MLESGGKIGSRFGVLTVAWLLALHACGGTVRTDAGRSDTGAGGGGGGSGGVSAGGVAGAHQGGKAPTGGTGGKGSAVCPPSLTRCGSSCVDLSSSSSNCGSCFSDCGPNAKCAGGFCQGSPPPSSSCLPVETYCLNFARCIDLQSNLFACGSCDTPCPNGWACIGGACDPGTCAVGSPCLGTDGVSRCVRLEDDYSNCGACNHGCNSGDSCQNGTCVPPDCSGLTYCPNTGCADTTADPFNCGGCDKTCGLTGSIFEYSAYSCTNGSCACGPLANPCGGGCASAFWYCPPAGFQGSAVDLCIQSARNPYERCACKNCLSDIQACSANTTCVNAMDCSLQSICPECPQPFSSCGDQTGAVNALADRLVNCMNTQCQTP